MPSPVGTCDRFSGTTGRERRTFQFENRLGCRLSRAENFDAKKEDLKRKQDLPSLKLTVRP